LSLIFSREGTKLRSFIAFINTTQVDCQKLADPESLGLDG